MRTLSIQEYERAELQALGDVPNFAVQAFAPVSHGLNGFPHRIRDESELARFLDIESQLSFQQSFQDTVGLLRPVEFDWIQRLWGICADFGEMWLNKPIIPSHSLIQPLLTNRCLDYMFHHRIIRLLEIGPGPGFLPCMYPLGTHFYIGIESLQAYYLLQEHLWNMVLSEDANLIESGPVNKFHEVVRGKDISEIVEKPAAGHFVHIPWWEALSRCTSQLPAIDAVTFGPSFHLLSEAARTFFTRLAYELTKARSQENPPGVLILPKCASFRSQMTELIDSFFIPIIDTDWGTFSIARPRLFGESIEPSQTLIKEMITGYVETRELLQDQHVIPFDHVRAVHSVTTGEITALQKPHTLMEWFTKPLV